MDVPALLLGRSVTTSLTMKYLSTRINRRSDTLSHHSIQKYWLPCRRFFFLLTSLVIVLAFGGSVMLLLSDTMQPLLQLLAHAPLSALPLLFVGLASLCFQIVVRPKLLDLFRAFIVSSAFLLWGTYQLLSAGSAATTLGDVVIVLFVIDLGSMMAGRLKKQGWPRRTHHESQPQPVDSSQVSSSSHPYVPEPLPVVAMIALPSGRQQSTPDLPARATPTSFALKRLRLIPFQNTHCCMNAHHPLPCSCKRVRVSSPAHALVD